MCSGIPFFFLGRGIPEMAMSEGRNGTVETRLSLAFASLGGMMLETRFATVVDLQSSGKC